MADTLASGLPRIAFVFGDASLAEHVRDAVSGHAEITYAAPAADFDAARLADAQVAAALVNVDGGDWLDEIESRLDAAGVPVVFNDPDISQRLEGWDRARWLRHLAAKLNGSDDFDPPRPAIVAAPSVAGAEPEAPAAPVEPEAPADSLEPMAAETDVQDTNPVASDAPSDAGETVAERPLSPHEIETLTADFVASPGLHTESASMWKPTSATLQVNAQFQAPSAAPQAAPPAEPAPGDDTQVARSAAEDVDVAPDASAVPEQTSAADQLDVDTEALSAMIDARLAEPEPGTVADAVADSADASPGEPSADPDQAGVNASSAAPELETPTAGDLATPATDPDADILDSLPSLDNWELIDADAEPEPAKPASERKTPEPSMPDSLADLTLVPMDPMTAAVRDMEPIERWIDESEGKTKGDGDKA